MLTNQSPSFLPLDQSELRYISICPGMTFHKDKAGHWLPIIVQGDPHKPRAKPSVSVMDMQPQSKPDSNNRVKKNALVGTGLRIEEGEAAQGNISSSSRLPLIGSSSTKGSDLIKDGPGMVPAPKIVVNEGVVMPVPNLDKAEDDSNIGNNEGSEDDQNPDGQVSTPLLTNQRTVLWSHDQH